MKNYLFPVAALAVPLLACAEEKKATPPVDANPPAKIEVATFALG